MSTIPFSPKQKPDESTLTDRQRKVLDAIRTHIDEQGFAPIFPGKSRKLPPGSKVRLRSSISYKFWKTRASSA